MLFNTSNIFIPKLSYSEERKHPLNWCIKQCYKIFLCLLACSAIVLSVKRGTNTPQAFSPISISRGQTLLVVFCDLSEEKMRVSEV